MLKKRLSICRDFCYGSIKRTFDGLEFNLRCGFGGYFQATQRTQIPKCWIKNTKICKFKIYTYLCFYVNVFWYSRTVWPGQDSWLKNCDNSICLILNRLVCGSWIPDQPSELYFITTKPNLGKAMIKWCTSSLYERSEQIFLPYVKLFPLLYQSVYRLS